MKYFRKETLAVDLQLDHAIQVVCVLMWLYLLFVNSEGFLAEVFHPWVRWEGPGSGFESSSRGGVAAGGGVCDGGGNRQILKPRSRPFPTHPGMKYFRKETLAVDLPAPLFCAPALPFCAATCRLPCVAPSPCPRSTQLDDDLGLGLP